MAKKISQPIPLSMVEFPEGGTIGQSLRKLSNDNYDMDWSADTDYQSQIDDLDSAIDQIDIEITDHENRIDDLENEEWVTKDTNQTITGVKTFTKPQIFSVLMRVADGSGGSANSWVLGYSYSEVSDGIANGYPENTGITEVIKITNNRTVQNFISSSSGILYTRSLHSASNKDWIKYVPEAPFDGNIKGRKDGEWVNVPSSSGGIESVTGTAVDNTDPLNPVINSTGSGGEVPETRLISTNNGITGGGDLSANRTHGLTGQASALHNLDDNGYIVRISEGNVAARQILSSYPITVQNGNGVAGDTTVGLNPSYEVNKTFISKGVKTLDIWSINPGDSVFDIAENEFDWSSSYYGIRNAVHWETYGKVTAGNGDKTLNLSWDVGGDVLCTLPVFFPSTGSVVEFDYHLDAHLAIRSSSQIILTMKFTIDSPNHRTYITSGNYGADMTNDMTIDIIGQFNDITDNNWKETYTGVYTY